MLQGLWITARRIHGRNKKRKNVENKRIVLPECELSNNVKKYGLEVVNKSGRKIAGYVMDKKERVPVFDNRQGGGVYVIPCRNCEEGYIGETGRELRERLREHRSDFRKHNTKSPLVLHLDNKGHFPDWDNAKILFQTKDREQRKLLEAATIKLFKCSNLQGGFVPLAHPTARMLLRGALECPYR
jgi:predicted GIY-YIG superfamily endonuclease